MSVSKISVLTLMACTLAACSSTDGEPGKSFDYKAAAVKVRSLEVPPELTMPAGNDRYTIPGGEGEGIARYSDFSKGGGAIGSGSSVLPETRSVRLIRNDAQRWLLVNDKAENIWPVIKAFWQENGLTIKLDDPQAGIIETDWAENRAKFPKDGFQKRMGLNTSGERDQYHTRLERSKDGNSTEIYIKHSGLQEVQDSNCNSYIDSSYKWLARERDPELEATMLQLLMAKLSGAASAKAEEQKVISRVQESPSSAKLLTLADGSKIIVLSEPFDKSWRKVSLALEQAGIALEDKDRSKGVFFLRAAQNQDKNAAAQVTVRESAGGCEVTVSNSEGASTLDALHVLDTLYQQISKR